MRADKVAIEELEALRVPLTGYCYRLLGSSADTDDAVQEDAEHRDLLRRYVTAFEAHDIEGLKAILRDDAVASMPPFPWRLTGAEAIAEAVGASESCAGARLVPCRMNGTQGFGQYRPGDDNVLRPFALVAVQIRDERIAQIVTFLGTQHRFREFGLPDSLRERETAAR